MPKQLDIDPYEGLANGIILQAVEDYRRALINKSKYKVESLERFFRSDWCLLLSSVNTEYIMEQIRKEVLNK